MPRIKKDCPYRRCVGKISLPLPSQAITLPCPSCGQLILITPKGEVSQAPQGEEEAD